MASKCVEIQNYFIMEKNAFIQTKKQIKKL